MTGRIKKVPAWAAARARARGDVVRSGQVFWTSDDIAALLDRVHARYQALAHAVAAASTDPDALGPEWRAAWAQQYAGWLNFRERVSDDVVTWGSTASTAQAFDQELDAWRNEYETRTGARLGTPRSDTAQQGRPGASGFLAGLFTGGGATLALGVAAALGVAYVAARR